MFLEVFHPVVDLFEALFVGGIVDENDSVDIFIVDGSDGSEAFLAGSVPHLNFSAAVLHLKHFLPVLNPDCRLQIRHVLVVCKTVQKTRLSNP
jgi:hypothetical protein